MAVEFENRNVSSYLSYLNPYLKITCYLSLSRKHARYRSGRECARIVTTIMTPSLKNKLRCDPAIWSSFCVKTSVEVNVWTKDLFLYAHCLWRN